MASISIMYNINWYDSAWIKQLSPCVVVFPLFLSLFLFLSSSHHFLSHLLHLSRPLPPEGRARPLVALKIPLRNPMLAGCHSHTALTPPGVFSFLARGRSRLASGNSHDSQTVGRCPPSLVLGAAWAREGQWLAKIYCRPTVCCFNLFLQDHDIWFQRNLCPQRDFRCGT